MRVLVTGGAGFVGSAIARALVDRGDDVTVLDDLSNGARSTVPEEARLIVGDIRDPAIGLEACRDAEVVFHQAALRSVPRSLDEPAVVHDVNATGTLTLLESARRAGVRRLVYASSSSVYGGVEKGRSREDMTPRPLSPYAVSKLAAEYYCAVYARLGWLSTVSLRYFNVFGPGQRADSKYAAVFPALISALERGEPPMIHWDGEQSRDFTFIGDVVRANFLAAEAADVDGAVLNAAGGRPRTINEVFETISSVMGIDIEPARGPMREGDIRHSYADTTRAKEKLGWEPETEWQEAVARTVSWFAGSERDLIQ